MSHALSIPPAVSRVEAETAADAEGVEALVMAAFGPGRFAKTAERLRDRSGTLASLAAELSYADEAHFVRDFKTVTGMTPRTFSARFG